MNAVGSPRLSAAVSRRAASSVVLVLLCLVFVSCGHGALWARRSAPAVGSRTAPKTIALPDVLRDIDAYPTPKGVNSETWKMLVTELKKQLVARSVDGKTLSVAVSGTENKVCDWKATYNAASNTETYEWTQKLAGDYNSDGQVGIADLAPLAQLYGDSTDDKQVSSTARSWTTGELLGSRDDELGWERWDYDAWDKIADGDGNKEVGIGDLQPIAGHYGEALSGYDVYFNGTKQYASGQSGSAPSILMPATLGTNAPVTNPDLPRTYSMTFGASSSMMAMKRPSTMLPANGLVPISDTGAMCSSETWVNLLIDVTAVVAAGTRQVTYTPTVTPPGTYTYSWDFGDGSALSSDQNPVHTFPADGDYYVSVAVTGADAQSKKDLPKLTLAVSAPWGPTGLSGTVSPTPPYDVTLTWNASTVPGVTYNVYYAATADSAFPARYNPPAPISGPTATITDAEVPGAAQMFYRVTAVQTLPAGKLESDYSNEWWSVPGTDTAPPVWIGVPGILSAVPGDGAVTLTWGTAVDAQSPPVHYTVYWMEDTGALAPGDFFNQALKEWDTASPKIFGAGPGETLVNGKTYIFGVRASDSAAVPNVDGNLVTLKATPTKLANAPWPKFRHDQFNTGRSPYVGAQTGMVKWMHATGAWVRSSAAIGVDGTIYVESNSGYIHALNPSDGSVKWTHPTGAGDQWTSSPAIGADGTVYIGSPDHNVYALNPSDGGVKWTYMTGNWIDSSPAIGADGTVYIGSADGKVYALNPSDGSVKWSYTTTGDWVESSPAIGADGTVYVGCDDSGTNSGKVYALNPSDGSVKWLYATGNSVGASPAVGADGTVYVADNDTVSNTGSVYALDPSNGSVKWTYATCQVWSSAAIGADGTVYVGSNNNNVYALNPSDGSVKWTYLTGNLVMSSPAIGADGTVYIGSWDNNVYALNPLDGTVKWTYTTGAEVYSSPAIGADGTVYIGSDDGNLYAIGPGGATHSVSGRMTLSGNGLQGVTMKIIPSGKTVTTQADGTFTIPGLVNGSYTLTPSKGGYTFAPSSKPVTVSGADVTGQDFAAVQSGLANTPWPKFHHDQFNTGRSPYVGAQTGMVKWMHATGAWVRSSPTIGADGTIYVGCDDNKVYALNPSDGSVKWMYATGNAVTSCPAVGADGTVYIGSWDKNVYALNPADGSVKWTHTTGGEVYSAAIGADGTVYVRSNDGNVYALKPSDGSVKWMYTIGPPANDHTIGSPAIGADGTVYIGRGDGNVYALNPADGSVKWTYATGDIVWSSPAIGADGTVYIGSHDAKVYALNSADGSVKWTYATGHWVVSSPAIGADGTVYVGSDDGNVYALNPADGSVKWSYTTGYYVESSPAIGADGTVYVGSYDNKLYAFGP